MGESNPTMGAKVRAKVWPPWEKVTLRWGPRLGQKFFTDVDYALVVFSTKGKGHLQGEVFAIGYKTAGDIACLLTGAN